MLSVRISTCGRRYLNVCIYMYIVNNIVNKQVQPETLPKNSIFSSCLQNIKLKNNTTLVPKTLQLKTLDFLQQTITMNKNAQWQMIKDSVLFALSWGFSVSLFHFYLKKKSTRGVHCIVLYFFFFLVASITLFATRVLFILEIV